MWYQYKLYNHDTSISLLGRTYVSSQLATQRLVTLTQGVSSCLLPFDFCLVLLLQMLVLM